MTPTSTWCSGRRSATSGTSPIRAAVWRARAQPAPEYGLEVVTTGGTGFGVMAIIVAVARGWIGREQAAERLLAMVQFMYRADSYGILPHFLHGDTGR